MTVCVFCVKRRKRPDFGLGVGEMKKNICAFVRSEKKYIIDEAALRSLMTVLARHMRLDEHCADGHGYPIYNIYFDTPGSDVIRMCSSKPYYKEKLRLRSYYLPEGDDCAVFLELKKKVDGMGSKRRAVMTLGQARAFLADRVPPPTDDYINLQVLGEIAAYLEQNPVVPTIHIRYERLALFDRDDPSLRVTVDKNIMTRRTALYIGPDEADEPLLEDGRYVMEIKTSSAFPLWLVGALSDNGLYSRGYSKYGQEFKRYTKNNSGDMAANG